MPQQEQQQSNDPFHGIRQTGNFILFAVGLLAGPYRLLFYRPGSMGPRSIGFHTIVGVMIGYPLVVQLTGPPMTQEGFQAFAWGNMALYGLLALHFLAAMTSKERRHSEECGQPLAKDDTKEFLLAGVAGLCLLPLCQGMACFVGLGWLASKIQLGLFKAKVDREAQAAYDSMLQAQMQQRAMERLRRW
ncbi:hypothetical protein [Tautonia plasticadhaerens]|uniref:Uncharacterized protein n=1 Tax=Tautonia plasticadhaerens TaxID=2527974 RepID=A0A518H2D9_9BACT|nr:hypothetical protein [Tautonia plasticadhaerens]QDV34994.1 hypothetical protein ElP_28910 [Tautonia plasticadhaerens]